MKPTSLPGLSFYNGQLKMPLTTLPVRSTKVSLGNANILMSPLSSWTTEDLRAIGPISDIVAPNLFHHLGVRKATEAYPQAALWGVKGLKEKRQRLNWHHTFNAEPWPYESELTAIPIQGASKYNEVVFVHHSSQSLICTDLIFNLQNVSGIGAILVFGLMGTYRKPAMSRLLKFMISDKKQFRDSLERILSFNFQNIVMAHGEVIFGQGQSLFKELLKNRGLL